MKRAAKKRLLVADDGTITKARTPASSASPRGHLLKRASSRKQEHPPRYHAGPRPHVSTAEAAGIPCEEQRPAPQQVPWEIDELFVTGSDRESCRSVKWTSVRSRGHPDRSWQPGSGPIGRKSNVSAAPAGHLTRPRPRRYDTRPDGYQVLGRCSSSWPESSSGGASSSGPGGFTRRRSAGSGRPVPVADRPAVAFSVSGGARSECRAPGGPLVPPRLHAACRPAFRWRSNLLAIAGLY